MGFSHGYGPGSSADDAIDLMRKAFDLGCTFYDTAEVYADGDNEKLLGQALAPMRDQVVIATKLHLDGELAHAEVGTHIRAHLDASLARLGVHHVELYYQHRVSDSIPVEDVAAVMGELIGEGKILGWGQSQATEQQIRAAHAVTPLTAIQSEYSMMERMFEADVIPTCAELGIGFVAFSPLASGFLSGQVSAEDTYTGDDVRRVITRFAKDNIRANQPLLDLLTTFATNKGATPAQISLAWMLYKKDFIVPIPGSRKLERIEETSVLLTSISPTTNTPPSNASLAGSNCTATGPTKTSPSCETSTNYCDAVTRTNRTLRRQDTLPPFSKLLPGRTMCAAGRVAQRRGLAAHDQQMIRGGVGAKPRAVILQERAGGGEVGVERQHHGGVELFGERRRHGTGRTSENPTTSFWRKG
jgi:aryl-alcohol dehydrogenase-like predicted oxidoreductase